MKRKRKIKIHPTVWIAAIFFAVNHNFSYFILLMFFVTLHELAHVAVAAIFGAKFEEILITPIGEKAVIRRMDTLQLEKRFVILFSGPLVRLTLGLLVYCFFCVNQWMVFAAYANLSIGLFNLLPVTPLDGGGIILLFFSQKFGTLRSGYYITLAGKLAGGMLIAFGVLQAILFPFNISLLVIGLYILSANRKEYTNIAYRFYKSMMDTEKRMRQGRILQVKYMIADGGQNLKNLVRFFSTDSYYFVSFLEDGEMVTKNQTQIIHALLEKGYAKKLREC